MTLSARPPRSRRLRYSSTDWQVEREAPQFLEEGGIHGRRGEAAVADDLGGDALADLGLGAPVGPEPPVRMGVDVDEPRRECQPRGAEGRPGRLP
jgi:hypothetical protein